LKTKSQPLWSGYRKLSDEALIHRYVHRHEEVAVHCLFDRYGHLVYGVCRRYLDQAGAAKEATRHIFIRLLDDLKKYHIPQFRPWLYRATKNYCLMQLHKSIHGSAPVVNTACEAGFDSDVYGRIEDESSVDMLNKAFLELPEEQRRCIELFYRQKINYAGIALKTGYTPQQVKEFIRNGKNLLSVKWVHR
jgi:RNA polymerase sigma-70 factor (ECF subfamily)